MNPVGQDPRYHIQNAGDPSVGYTMTTSSQQYPQQAQYIMVAPAGSNPVSYQPYHYPNETSLQPMVLPGPSSAFYGAPHFANWDSLGQPASQVATLSYPRSQLPPNSGFSNVTSSGEMTYSSNQLAARQLASFVNHPASYQPYTLPHRNQQPHLATGASFQVHPQNVSMASNGFPTTSLGMPANSVCQPASQTIPGRSCPISTGETASPSARSKSGYRRIGGRTNPYAEKPPTSAAGRENLPSTSTGQSQPPDDLVKIKTRDLLPRKARPNTSNVDLSDSFNIWSNTGNNPVVIDESNQNKSRDEIAKVLETLQNSVNIRLAFNQCQLIKPEDCDEQYAIGDVRSICLEDIAAEFKKTSSGDCLWKFFQNLNQLIQNAEFNLRALKNDAELKNVIKAALPEVKQIFQASLVDMMKKFDLCCAECRPLNERVENCANSGESCAVALGENSWVLRCDGIPVIEVCEFCFNDRSTRNVYVSLPLKIGDEAKLIPKEMFKIRPCFGFDEPLVECCSCKKSLHRICVKHFIDAEDFYCDQCIVAKGIPQTIYRAVDLPQCHDSCAMEGAVNQLEAIRQNQIELVVRLMDSSVDTFEVSAKSAKLFPSGRIKFQYQSRVFAIFQKHPKGDVMDFAIYVKQFYDDRTAECNRRWCNLSYVESAKLLNKMPRGTPTQVYQLALRALFRQMGQRGFEHLFIWICPPQGKTEYIFNLRDSKGYKFNDDSRQAKLKQFYDNLLTSAKRNGDITDFQSLHSWISNDNFKIENFPQMPDEGDIWKDFVDEVIGAKNVRKALLKAFKAKNLFDGDVMVVTLKPPLQQQPGQLVLHDLDKPGNGFVTNELMRERSMFLKQCRDLGLQFSNERYAMYASALCIRQSSKKPIPWFGR